MTVQERIDGPRQPWTHWVAIIWMLAVRQFRLRFLRSRLGVGWALVQPIIQALALSFLFTRIFHVHGIDHYALYVLSGVMTWQAFQGSTSTATTSAVDNGGLLRKVEVPAIVFVLSQVVTVCLIFCVQITVLLALMALAGTVTWQVILLPVVILGVALTATAVGSLTCSLHVAFRDVKFLVDSGLLLTFYATPILYNPATVPYPLRRFLELNPMFGVVSLARSAALGTAINTEALLIALAVTSGLMVVGLALFRVRSRDFADLA